MNRLRIALALAALLPVSAMADVLTDAVTDVAKQEAKNQAANALQGTGADKIISGVDQVNSGMNQLKNIPTTAQSGGKSLADTARPQMLSELRIL